MTNLVDSNEKILFNILAVLAITVWVGLIIGTLGTALLFLGIGYIVFLFVQSGFISYLKGSGAIVAQDQFPDLYEMHVECCKKLGIEKPPVLILIHADGMFNALATRFLKRHYVILFSDIVDALEDHPEALKFYIGHELGHVKRNHVLWMPILAPVSWLPLIGAGYSRAREFTCDLLGLHCCASNDDAVKGMAALSVGARRWKNLNIESFKAQAQQGKGFWMSFHEVVSDYPWLVKRITVLSDGDKRNLPGRNPFAWILGLFIPRLSIVSLIVLYMLILLGTGVITGQELIEEAQRAQQEQLDSSYYEDDGYDYQEDNYGYQEEEGNYGYQEPDSGSISAEEYLQNYAQ